MKDVLDNYDKANVKQGQMGTISRKFNETKIQWSEIDQQLKDRKNLLKLKLETVEFEREASELLAWLNEKRGQAVCEDYGQDIEHLNLIKTRFVTLNDEIRASDVKYLRVRKLGAELVNVKSPDAKIIRKRLDDLKTARELLDEDLNQRKSILSSAAEIHNFNKDVQDLLRRISVKEAAFVSDLGRDSHSCESLIRNHEIYIEELTALKVRLQDLNKQSEQLRLKHPGDTAETISFETNQLISRFRNLVIKTENRTILLNQSIEYFKFIQKVKNVNEWIEDTASSLKTQPQVVYLFTASQSKQEHENLSFEMTQRDADFKSLDEIFAQLTQGQNHPNKLEIIAQTDKAMKSREDLFRLWNV